MTPRQASIFRDGFSQLQMEAQQTAASSNHSHFNSPTPDTGPLKALAGATQTQTITLQYCNYVFQPVGPPSHRLFLTMWEVPWLCTVFPLPAPLKNKLWTFSKPPRHHAQCLPARTVWYPLSQIRPMSHSWPGARPKTFPFSFVAQRDLNNRSHLICFLHGSKETVFHFVRPQVKETS